MTDQELNELVAKGMGWTYDEKFQDWAEAKDIIRPLPDFCNDLQAAIKVVDFQCDLHKYPAVFTLIRYAPYKWEARFLSGSVRKMGIEETPARAICTAFLAKPE